MKVTHDKEADAAYIYLKNIQKGGVARSRTLSERNAMFVLDFDKNDCLIGIEVLGANKGVPKELLKEAPPEKEERPK